MKCPIYFTCIILCGLSYLEQGSPVLLFANRENLYLINASNVNTISDAIALSDTVKGAIFVDFLYSQNLVFWANVEQRKIYRATIGQNLSNITELITTGLNTVKGLVCDWLAGNLYWGDPTTHRIEVSNTDGGHRKVLFWKNVDKPRAIALDPLNGYMYWTDWGKVPKIERASMDGSQDSRTVLIDDKIQHPNGLTIDYQQRKLYWADSGKDSIFSSDMEGAHRQTILHSNDFLRHPFSLTILNGTLFWTDWYTNSIISCKHNGQETKRILTGLNFQPMSIKTYDPFRQPQGSTVSPCAINNSGCSHLCLTSPFEPYFTCACPTGVLFNKDNATCAEEPPAMLVVAQRDDIRYISLDTPDFTDVVIPLTNVTHAIAIDYDPVDEFVYWTDDRAKTIRRAYLNGSDNQVIIDTDIENPDGLAIDWIGRNLYWTDTGLDRIEVARLDGSVRKIIVSDGLDEPRAICLDPAKGYMWWTDWGSVPKIERAYLDGSYREVIIDRDVAWINGIAVDTETDMLYWCDAKLDTIEVANTDGSNRRVLVKDLPHAFGLSVLGNFIYWTDWQNRSIQRVNKYTGGNRSVIIDNTSNLMGLTAIYPQHITSEGWNTCANANGGCSDLCIHTPTWTNCACPIGKELDSSERNCIVSESYMLYSQRTSIKMMTLSPTPALEKVHLSRPNVNPYNIDVHRIHTGGREMYWTDKANKNICRAFVSGTSTMTVVQEGINVPEDLAVDWIADNLYWIDSGKQPRIEVSRLNGSHRKVLIWKYLKQPRSIAVNPMNWYMYWTDGSMIERAHLDGSHRQTILTKSGQASDLLIDYTDQRLYWINNRRNIIESSDLMGKDRQQVVTDEINAPVSLALFEGYIYWVDSHKNTMEKALTTNVKYRATVLGQFDKVKDIVFYDTSRLTGSNACSTKNGVKNGGCSDLCFVLPDHNTTTHICSCPYNLKLSNDGTSCAERKSSFLLLSKRSAISELILKDDEGNDREIISDIKESEDVLPIPVQNVHALDFDPQTGYVYWIAGHKRAIRRSRMDGSDESTIVHDASSRPFDIVVDPFSTLLFWSCSMKNIINILRMDDLDKDGVIIQEKLEKPRYLAVNPKTGHIIWTNNGQEPSIRTSLLDGTDIVTLVSTELNTPGPIAVDPKSDMLFWVDQAQKVIEAIGISGENRHRHILYRRRDDEVNTIVGLAVFNELIYFLDKGNLQIQTINQTSGAKRPVIKYNNRYINEISATIDLEVTEHNPCDSVNLNCSHICISNVSSAHCACPLNLKLLLDLKTCRERLSCSPNQFQCKSGEIHCISKEWTCDGLPECADKSDEEDCESCPLGYFQCAKDKKCIRGKLVCDGKHHCIDGEDEIGCCGKFQNKCMTTPQCFDDDQRCDGIAQCDNGEDEIGCCEPTQIRCLTTNQCYDKTQRCDGSFDCFDNSDEYNC